MKFKFTALSKNDFGAFTLRLWNHSPIPIEITQLIRNVDVVPVKINSHSERRTSENQIKYNPGNDAMECMPRKMDRCSGNGFLCRNIFTQKGFHIDTGQIKLSFSFILICKPITAKTLYLR